MLIPKSVEDRIANKPNIKEGIMKIQNFMEKQPGVMHGNCFPLNHSFGDGLYIREITMPKNMLVVSRLHKFTHPYFILKGKVSVMTEDGVQHIQAPFAGMTKAGTKRVLYIHEECVWVTVHSNPENKTKTDELENDICVDNFEDYDKLPKEDIKQIGDFMKEVEAQYALA